MTPSRAIKIGSAHEPPNGSCSRGTQPLFPNPVSWIGQFPLRLLADYNCRCRCVGSCSGAGLHLPTTHRRELVPLRDGGRLFAAKCPEKVKNVQSARHFFCFLAADDLTPGGLRIGPVAPKLDNDNDDYHSGYVDDGGLCARRRHRLVDAIELAWLYVGGSDADCASGSPDSEKPWRQSHSHPHLCESGHLVRQPGRGRDEPGGQHRAGQNGQRHGLRHHDRFPPERHMGRPRTSVHPRRLGKRQLQPDADRRHQLRLRFYDGPCSRRHLSAIRADRQRDQQRPALAHRASTRTPRRWPD